VADISDFYNQIYHHRLENSLAAAGVPDGRRRSLIRFLGQLTATQSSGIPVGPSPSILLAELSMSDVDSYLLRKGSSHTRYVDDFRIFCRSSREALRTLHDLAEYLYTAHRLSLEPTKSRILPVDTFISKELRDPEQEEKSSFDAALAHLQEQFSTVSMYESSEPMELTPDLMRRVNRDNLRELFVQCVEERPLHLGIARYLLRRATGLRTNVLVDAVFANIRTLSPVLREVTRYLGVAMRKEFSPVQFEMLKSYLIHSDFGDLPFVQMWVLEMMRGIVGLRSPKEAFPLTERYAQGLGRRPVALLAKALGLQDWVRQHKETWRGNEDWDRRAIIYSATILPDDERRHWINYVKDVTQGLDGAVAASVSSAST
jgi:hypothetical protein